ncbi:hypothetical protein MYK68_06855 [Gordonia sp. PP30]|uniref:hypothetical protein n=1 Tax=Gordonia sp. PP30 TaxID=2935861 RepID=UPI0020005615|nr:hypothetical protein [Gordonia sp. PP30]UQE76297.1 hypothetical protein MYK68_06855 [Gordonia sp. PP30]
MRDLDLGALLRPRPDAVTREDGDASAGAPVDSDEHATDPDAGWLAEFRPTDECGQVENNEPAFEAPDPEEHPAEPAESGGGLPAAFLAGQALPSDPYRPTEALGVLVCALFGTCTVPGCEQPAWNCELDHCEEFDQFCPASGGPTCLCNVGPKCKRHHLLKTFLGAANPEDGWVDEQWIDDRGVVWTAITAYGITVETRAENQWLFPQLAGVSCAHRAHPPPESSPTGPTRPGGAGGSVAGGGLRAATAYKHAWRRAERARLRRARERAEAADGPPPF